MFYELGKKAFNFLVNAINFIRLMLIFGAFFTTLYWLLQIGQVTFVEGFAFIFEPVKDFVHNFYNRTVTTDSATVDFSFLIGSFLMLLVTWGLKFVIDYIQLLEKKYDEIHKNLKNKTQDLFNLSLDINYKNVEQKIKKVLVLVSFSTKNLAKDIYFDKDAKMGEDEKQKLALSDFSESIHSAFTSEKKLLKDSVLLYFNDFKNIDNLLLEVEKRIGDLKTKYKEEKWELIPYVAVETYSEDKEVVEKYKNLMMLLKLQLHDEMVCLSSFTQRYALVSNARYIIESKGVYTIHEEEDIFSIKNKEKHTKKL